MGVTEKTLSLFSEFTEVGRLSEKYLYFPSFVILRLVLL